MEEITASSIASVPIVSKPKRLGRVKKWFLRGALSLIVVASSAQVLYTFSGSDQWEKVGERRGVVLYAMKRPGWNVKEFKAIWKVRTTLSKFVKFAKEEDSPEMGMYDFRDIEKQGDQLVWSTWKETYPSPFWPRDYVVKNEFSQDPQTNTLIYRVTSDAERAPHESCCVRVTTMKNIWTITPLPGGEAQIEWQVDMNMGGYIPYFMQNMIQTHGMLYFAPRVQRFLDQKRYDGAKYSWIDDSGPKSKS
jgi:START domain